MSLTSALRDSATVAVPTTSTVNSSASSVTLLPANASRQAFTVANASTQLLYLSFTSPATTTNAFAIVAANSNYTFSMPFTVRGAVYGIWASANGNANLTEFM
jgi:hypothetical protein